MPEDLPGLTRQRLEQRLLGALNMARKAGQLTTGATRVRAAIEAGGVIALITATDAAADGREKLLSALHGAREAGDKRRANHSPPCRIFELLDSGQMGLALGLENVIHAALTKGAAAQSALARAERLARFMAN